jgi:uncharacterized protein DUF885
VHEYDDRLPDWSPEGLAAAVDAMHALRSSLPSSLQPAVPLTDVHARDRELALAFLDIQIAEHESGHFQRGNPSLALGESIFSIIALMTGRFGPAADRIDAAIARLTAIPDFLAGARRSIAAGVPDEWRVRCLRECDGADRLLDDGMRRWAALESLPDKRAAVLIDAAKRARAAYHDWRRWLEREPPSAPGEAYACGPDLFDLVLSRGHWCNRSRASLSAETTAAFEDALSRLDEQSRSLAPGGWPEVQQRLMDDYPAVDEYLPTYMRVWQACGDRAQARDLLTWPDYPIRFVPIPPHTRQAAPYLYYLFYRSPAPFDRLPVHEHVVPPIDSDMPRDEQLARLRATNTSVITLNHVVHHASIGHHVQNHYACRGESEIGRIAAVDGASRIGMIQGGTMAEGWACYATDLMDEIGFFTPEQSAAQQHTRARLLARAVVDIGLHERSMTFDDAVALYRDRVGMAQAAARSEACKNSMFPGTAIMYWLGTEGLHQLRRERQRVEGASFSLRRFHDRVLSFGSIPVPLIALVY